MNYPALFFATKKKKKLCNFSRRTVRYFIKFLHHYNLCYWNTIIGTTITGITVITLKGNNCEEEIVNKIKLGYVYLEFTIFFITCCSGT